MNTPLRLREGPPDTSIIHYSWTSIQQLFLKNKQPRPRVCPGESQAESENPIVIAAATGYGLSDNLDCMFATIKRPAWLLAARSFRMPQYLRRGWQSSRFLIGWKGELCSCACLVSNYTDTVCGQLLEEKLRDKNGGKFTKKKFKQYPLMPSRMKLDRRYIGNGKNFYLWSFLSFSINAYAEWLWIDSKFSDSTI